MRHYCIALARGLVYFNYHQMNATIPEPYQLWQWKASSLTYRDLNLGGLGAPKAVNIPKLILHVVYINTTKDDPEHEFEFVTMTRDNYPVYLMEQNNDYIPGTMLKNHSFDSQKNRKKYKSKKWFHLSKPKQVAKGSVGICQYYKVDETKLSAEQ